MSQYIEKYKKNIAIDMRKRGLSYSEIENRIHVPKSTLSFWLKGLKLTEEQSKKLNEKKLGALKRVSEKKSQKTLRTIEEIKNTSAKDIKEITKKELWMMGIILCWRERLLDGNKNDMNKGVQFTSSDPYLIKLFLLWLKDIGNIETEEIIPDIFIEENMRDSLDDIIEYWSEVTDFSKESFNHIYFHKNNVRKKRKGRNVIRRTKFGLLRIRVRSSSMLARQIAGWMKGVIKYYW